VLIDVGIVAVKIDRLAKMAGVTRLPGSVS
jgi:hypothetical protein